MDQPLPMAVGFLDLEGWTQQPIAAVLLVALTIAYFVGRARSRAQVRPTRLELTTFALGMVCLWTAFASPLVQLKFNYLFARTVQQALVGIVAPPLLIHGCLLAMLWQLVPAAWQSKIMLDSENVPWALGGLRWLLGPGPCWLLTLAVFALWHDSATVNWVMAHRHWANGFLVVYWVVFMLFWWHAMAAQPGIFSPLPVWVRFLYLIVGGEIANMITGVTLAFRQEATYSYYSVTNTLGPLSAVQDQMISGGIIWVTGSFIYIGMAVALLGQVLVRRKFVPRLPPRDWQSATLLTIAPGLEDRVKD